METYRLKSRLVDHDHEFIIQTVNDANLGAISSEIYIDGHLAETASHPHPLDIRAEEVLSLLKETHGEKKRGLETLLTAYRRIMSEGDPEMMLHLGTALYHRGFYTEARDVFRAAVALDPKNHQARSYLGVTCLALDEVDEALVAAAAAVQARPGYADYRNGYGEALLAGGQFEQAHQQFSEAVRINLYYGDAYFNLGLTYLSLASTHELVKDSKVLGGKAQDCFRRAAMVNVGYDAGYFEDGMRAVSAGDMTRAWAAMNVVKASWKNRRRRELAGFHMRYVLHPEWVSERMIGERIRYLEGEIRRNPSYVDLYTELGRCYLEQARLAWQRGVAQYRRATELNPALLPATERLRAAEEQYEHIRSALDAMGPKG